MKLTYTYFLSFFTLLVFPQDKNSLLWEVSGNGLNETSYLYGTMHVSKKIAFHLDDVFYEALDKSDIIALESDPSMWLDNDETTGNRSYGNGNGPSGKGFYTYPFAMQNPKKEDIAAYLASEDRLINSILYRTNELSQNFEEDTYLDMFIYQAGLKFDKKLVALEDMEESSALVGRASLNAMKQKPDEWLQKKMRQQDPIYLMQDAYRERNINLLDSIDQAVYTQHYLKNMLYIRNQNMANRMDSVMRTGKVFTGIGAAHLPGEKGVIRLLRNKGYTVTPLVSESTTKGNLIKEKIKTKIRKNTYKKFGPDDDFFSIGLPNKLYPISDNVNTSYISPDLANGSYFMVIRIPKFSFLKKNTAYSIEDINQLLFENIPGKILEKTQLQTNGFNGLDIKNKLKNGDHQRYQIYVTPLEILIFKMGGEGDYVSTYSDIIFNSIAFRQINKKKIVLSSGYNDFEVEMPSLYSFTNRFRNGSRLIEGYDEESDAYYFLRKVTLNDLTYIEEDTFELKQMHKRFYEDLRLKPKYGVSVNKSLTSEVVFDSIKHQKLYLKTAFRHGDYYMMGALTKYDDEAADFFDSFKIKDPAYREEFRRVIDTALHFSTVTSVKPPKFVENSNNYFNGRKKLKSYSPYNKKTVYQNKNNDAVTVVLNKSHDFLMLQSIDSVWAMRKKIYSNKRFNIIKEKAGISSEGHHELQLTLTDTASSRGIMIKNILKGGVLYEIKALADTIENPSRFVKEFFDNFQPNDTLIGRDILQDKTQDFFTALRTNDSIVMGGYRFLKFDRKNIDSLKYYISEFDFTDDNKAIQAFLIEKLGQFNDPEVISFFKEFYLRSYNSSKAQVKILQAISKKSNEASTELLLELMAKDLPLVSSKMEIYTIFKPYSDSLPLAKKLYPELLEFSNIEEYKSPIFSLLAILASKGYVKPNTYKKYRKQILTDAKIQLKRQFNYDAFKREQYQRNHNINFKQNENVLEDYMVLLHPFMHEKEIKQFFNRLITVKDAKLRTTHVKLMAKNNFPIPNGMLVSLAGDINSRVLLFNKLEGIGKLNLFPSQYKSQKYLAEASIFAHKEYNNKQDSIVFVDQTSLQYRGKNYTGYYYKISKIHGYNKNTKMHLVVFENSKDVQSNPYYKNDGALIEGTDSDTEIIDFVTEEFMLKDRKRAMAFNPDHKGGYGSF